MSVSLESRVPFLDQRIIDFAFKLPTAHLIQKSRGVLLRKFLSGRVPSNILELPKSGFVSQLKIGLDLDCRSGPTTFVS